MVRVTLWPAASVCQAGSFTATRWKSPLSPPMLLPLWPATTVRRPKPDWSDRFAGAAVGTSNWNSVPPGRARVERLVMVSLGEIG